MAENEVTITNAKDYLRLNGIDPTGLDDESIGSLQADLDAAPCVLLLSNSTHRITLEKAGLLQEKSEAEPTTLEVDSPLELSSVNIS